RDFRCGRVRSRDLARLAAIVVLAGAIPFAVFGNPITTGRSFFAWGQHYALGQVMKYKLSANPWSDWGLFVTRDFGHVSTVGEAFHANPRAFFAHLVFNLQTLPGALEKTVEPIALFPAPVSTVLLLAAGFAGIVGAVGAASRLRRDPADRALRIVAFVWAALAGNILVPAILIHPRAHYLLLGIYLAFALAVGGVPEGVRLLRAGLGRLLDRPRSVHPSSELLRSHLVLGALAAFLIVATPNRAYGLCPQTALGWVAPPQPDDHRVGEVIGVMRDLHIAQKLVVLEGGYSFALYAGVDFDYFTWWTKDRSFLSLIRDAGVNLMVLNADIDLAPGYADDSEYRSFVANPAAFGFRVVPVPGQTARIVVRDDVVTR
ncbi:MAG TPA: hypothetical protein VHU80_24360, partial [Polyangiaceae bacterium]|nr:hypothetical protein [Polyangiaceae bacterium]